MRKLILLLLVVSLMIPSGVYSKLYKRKRLIDTEMPTRLPALYPIGVYVSRTTGDLVITPTDGIMGLTITLTGNGVTYINTTVSLGAGQSYTDCLDFLNAGTYILTLSTAANGMIDLYEITVEDD